MASEFDLIRRFFAQSPHQFGRPEVVVGIGDDAAVLELPDRGQFCVATDMLVADVHFPAAAPAELVARRALAVNLSDLAAMGATPLCFTLGLVMGEATEAWLTQFSRGLLELAQQYDCPLVGGDTVRGPLCISITVHGLLDKKTMIRRQGAEPGDRVFVSGQLGDGALALPALGLNSHLEVLKELKPDSFPQSCREAFMAAYYQPKPRIELAQACAPLVSCGIDLSDGLAGDLNHILRANDVGAGIDIDALPVSAAASACVSTTCSQLAALYGGDDYELCFCVPPKNVPALTTIADRMGICLSCVGEITDETGMRFHDRNGKPVSIIPSPYAHFAEAMDSGNRSDRG